MSQLRVANQLILPAVAAIIFDKQGRVLLQKRQDVDRWGLLGGHVEFGETVEQAIYREIAEETNFTVQIERLIGVYSEPSTQVYFYSDHCVHYITTYFKGTLMSNFEEGFRNEETQELGLFEVNALPTELAQLNPFWLQDALNSENIVFVR